MRQQLNFSWKFVNDFKEEYLANLPSSAKEVNIPHNPVDVPYNYFHEDIYQKIFTYEKVFDVEGELENKSAFITFDGFMSKAKIYLNDKYLGEYVSLYLPVRVDVSEAIKQKNNRLVVVLDSHEDKNYPPFGYAVDYLTFSGIYREVYLDILPKTYIKYVYVYGNSKGELYIEQQINNPSNVHSVKYELYFEGKLIKEFVTPQLKLEDAKLWDTSNPNLYTLKIILTSSDGIHEVTQRFGFRDTIFKKDGFYLNDKKIKLIGLNRHQSYPIMGYAASKSLQEDDANKLKFELGVNVVRTSHYPQSKHFLNRCDEIGLLVVNEIPGWQFISKEQIWREKFYQNVTEMVWVERNHPSLILHGVRIDESIDDHELYTRANEIAHKFDPHRQTIGVRNTKNSELLEDVYGYNDFVNDSLKRKGLSNRSFIKTNHKPLLITEYMGHMDPTKATSDIPDLKDHALRHLRVINDNFKAKSTAGAIGWCFADYHTHTDFGSGDHICPHGVCDIYRNKKWASAAYASQQDEFPVMEVINNLKPGDYVGAIFENTYVITNCDYVDVYKNNEFVKRFYPNFKDKRFSSLKHPPILIDDLVGETFKEEQFDKKYWPRIGKRLSKAGISGLSSLNVFDYLFLGRMMAKYKMKYDDLLALWLKHVGTWGGMAKTYTFKGYKNDQEVITREVGPSTKFDLKVDTNKTELINEDTYDTLRVSLRYVDEHGSLLNYASKVVSVDYTGPIELIGEKHQSLLGGQLSLYFRSKQTVGKAKISIKLEDISKSIEIDVK